MSSNPGNEDNNQEEDKNNEDEVEWDKMDNEDRNLHTSSGTIFHNTPQPTKPRSATPYSTGIITPNVGFAILRCRLGVLGNLMDGLKNFSVAKNKQKELYDITIQKTYCLEISVNAEVGKKCLDIEKKVDAY